MIAPPLVQRSRRRLMAALAGTAWLWAGCAAPPRAGGRRPPAQQAALRGLGFVEGADDWQLDLGGRVIFAVDDATLSPEALASLTRVVRVLLGIGIDTLTVEGHADNQGDDDHNRRLSLRRAEAVAEALVARGFSLAKIERRGFGASRPIADNARETGRLQNRRAVLIVSSV